MDNTCRSFAVLGICIAIGLASAGYFVSNTLYKAKIAANTATVKGLAEREVKSDLAVWTITFKASTAELAEAYKKAETDQKKVQSFLETGGFTGDSVALGAFTVSEEQIRNEDTGEIKQTIYSIFSSVTVRTNDVDKVAQLNQGISTLVGQGVMLENSNPKYLFTKLNEIKPGMVGEATRNARISAEQFAKDADSKVGRISSAMQGPFSFAGRDSTSSDDSYGSDESSIYKIVRVVTTITFYLDD